MSLLPDDEILVLLNEFDGTINDVSVEELGDLNNCDLLYLSEDILITEVIIDKINIILIYFINKNI